MNINSLTFLYLFLPGALLVFNLAPKKLKSIVLAVISGGFILFSKPEDFIFLSADIIILYILSEALSKNSENQKRKKAFFLSALFINIGAILFYSVQSQLSGGFSPFVLMVISFTAIGYFVDLYKGEAKAIHSPADFIVFLPCVFQ